MALTGSLLDFTAADILQLIKIQNKDGTLMVRERRHWVSLGFQGGDVVAASRSGCDMLDGVGRRLVHNNALSNDAWGRARTTCRRRKIYLDRVLKDMDEPAWEQVAAETEAYLRASVLALFGWREGDYTFDSGTPSVVPLEQGDIALSTDLLLMEGTSHAADWGRIFERVPGFSVVFTACIQSDDNPDNGPDNGKPRAGGLSDTERGVLDRVDGKKDVQQVVDAGFLSLFETCEALAWLVDRGMIRQTERGKIPSRKKRLEVTEAPAPARHYGQHTVAGGIGILCLLLVFSCAWLVVTGPGPRSADATDRFMEATWSFRDHKVRQALGVYRMVYGHYPALLDQLAEVGLVADLGTFSGMNYSSDGKGYTLHAG